MGQGYMIDVGEMTSLTNTLEHAEEAMNGANDALRDASPWELGSAGLDKAGADFQDKWEYGIGKIADLSGEMTGGLRATLKTYKQAEESISKLFPSDVGAAMPTADGGDLGSAINSRLSGGA